MTRIIQFAPPDIRDSDIEAVVATLKSGWITTGPKVMELEEKLKSFLDAQIVSGMSCATAGMETILRYLGIGPGDEVITSVFTYTASASAIYHAGARIRLADVTPGGFHMDPRSVEALITEKTKAVIAVDYGGLPCNYDGIYEVLTNHRAQYKPLKGTPQEQFDRIICISDAAHAFGTQYKGKYVGNVADFTSFSFHAVKNVVSGEGGALSAAKHVPLEDDFKLKIRLWSLHGQNKDAYKKLRQGWKYDIELLGYKYNMTDMEAALVLSQLNRLDEIYNYRRELFELYKELLASEPRIHLLHFLPDEVVSSYHIMPIRIEGFDEPQRDELMEKLAERGVPTNVHFIPLAMHTAYKNLGFRIEHFPMAYATYQNLVTLPLHMKLTHEDVKYICEQLLNVLRARG